MTTWLNTSNQKTRPEEERLYQHLLHLVQVESPQQVITRFRALFVEGSSYPESEIMHLVDQITSLTSAQEFKFLLNRCCHIMINRWHMQPQLRVYIPELIDLFANPSTRIVTSPRHSRIRRLHEFVQIFTQSEQYLTLRRLAQIMTQNHDWQSQTGGKPLLTLIRRYPYLYDHFLMGDNFNHEHQRTVRQIQYQVQKKFEINLSQYVTYQVRCHSLLGRQEHIQKVSNPTLLSDRDLNSAIKQFIGKVDGSYTYHDLAQNFINQTRSHRSFKAFKSDLHEYLVSSLRTGASKQQFDNCLYKKLQIILPESENQKVDEFLLVRTCSQLLNFLVVESKREHFTFVDLVSNQGTTITTALLLKVVLICRKVKPYLEKRLAILFNHYEYADTSCIQWLVRALEKLNIALSIYFGNIDISYFNQVYLE